MASSVSGQDETGGQDGAIFPARDYLMCPMRKISLLAK